MQNEADWTPLLTERLFFRRPHHADLAAALEIHLDPRTNEHHPEPHTVTTESVRAKLQAMVDHWDEHGFGVWAVALRGNRERLVGFTGVSHRLVHDRATLNLYYRYRPEVWGRGLASEAAGTAVERGRELLPELPITAYTTPGNIGSQRTALSVGLQRRPELDIDHGHYTDIYLATGW